MKPSRLTISTDAIEVTCTGPVEALDAVQADAFEVRLPEPSDEEARWMGRELARWMRGLKRKQG